MMENKEYKCECCGKKLKNSDDISPECCGKKMKQLPLDVCIQPQHAEHARSDEIDEPCDEGRSG